MGRSLRFSEAVRTRLLHVVRATLLPGFIDANTATGQSVVERDRCVDGGTTGHHGDRAAMTRR
jgi:hypothetical protein